VRWTCRAAENGSLQALSTLAGFFLTGNALPLSRFSAYCLLKECEKLGDASARATLSSLRHLLTRSEQARARSVLRAAGGPKRLVETLLPREKR
jgi:uncharacterized protein